MHTYTADNTHQQNAPPKNCDGGGRGRGRGVADDSLRILNKQNNARLTR